MIMKPTLTQLSFTISLIGILFLLFLITFPPQKITPISNINSNQLNKQVKVQGTITNIKEFNQYNFLLITVKDPTGEIDILLSSTNLNQTNLTKSQNITIIGKVTQYKNNLQVQAEKITTAE